MNKDFEKECRNNFNKVGIYGGTIMGRLVGYCETDEDCYYILREEDRSLHRSSMVGGFNPLPIKGFEYTYRIWDFIVPEEKEFILEERLSQDV
jgi:hypothetical protein